MFSEIFYTFLVTTISGLVLAFIAMLYKSKCISIEFCCCKIIRDIDAEKEEDEIEMNLEHSTASDNNNIRHSKQTI